MSVVVVCAHGVEVKMNIELMKHHSGMMSALFSFNEQKKKMTTSIALPDFEASIVNVFIQWYLREEIDLTELEIIAAYNLACYLDAPKFGTSLDEFVEKTYLGWTDDTTFKIFSYLADAALMRFGHGILWRLPNEYIKKLGPITESTAACIGVLQTDYPAPCIRIITTVLSNCPCISEKIERQLLKLLFKLAGRRHRPYITKWLDRTLYWAPLALDVVSTELPPRNHWIYFLRKLQPK
jgi:hypothetical protein